MNSPSLQQLEFAQIVDKTDELLWKAYDASTGKGTGADVRLRFPSYRLGATETEARLRVSEQEARFIMTGELAKSSLLYAVEVPTLETYRFTGRKEISGQTDVFVYQPDAAPMWNVEFKAHGLSVARTSKGHISKDLEKLLAEKVDGFWFHTLEGVDNSTLTAFWEAFSGELRKVALKLNEDKVLIPPKALAFHVCVLRQGFSLEIRLDVDPKAIDHTWLQDVLMPPHLVKRDSLVSIAPANGWKVSRSL